MSRDASRNHGAVVDRAIPADRYIVGALVVLVDDEGGFSVYPSVEGAKFGWKTATRPDDEVILELAAMIKSAWELASLGTTQEKK